MASAPARAETALVEQLVARVDNPPFGLRAFSSRLRKNAGTDGSVHSTDSHLTDSTFAVGDRFVCPRVFPQPARLALLDQQSWQRLRRSREPAHAGLQNTVGDRHVEGSERARHFTVLPGREAAGVTGDNHRMAVILMRVGLGVLVRVNQT